MEVEAGREESTALNSPELKWTLGAGFQDFGRLTGGFTVRHVDEYYFRSGANRGFVPGFTTLDANLGYRLDRFNTTVSLGVSNLFACGGRFTYPDTDVLFANPTDEQPLVRLRREAPGDDQHAGDRHDGLPGREVPDAVGG